MLVYPVEMKKDTNGTWLVSFPDVPEAVTFGETKAAALAQAVEALETALSFYVDEGKDLPKASPVRNRPLVSPSLKGTMKLGIYMAMREQKVRKTELARRMGVTLVQIDRILDLTHSSRIEQLEAASKALRRRIAVEMVAA